MASQLCDAYGPLDKTAVKRMLKLTVLINYGRIFEEEDSLQDQAASMHVRCHHDMAKRVSDGLEIINRQPGILTSAVQFVLQRAPAHLEGQ